MSNRRRRARPSIVDAGRAVAHARLRPAGEGVGAVNSYQCRRCQQARYTINRDAGTTPATIPCDCGEAMWSTWYRLPMTFDRSMIRREWYSLTVAQALVFPGRSRAEREAIKDHVARGGLLLAVITPETARRFVVGPAELWPDTTFLPDNGEVTRGLGPFGEEYQTITFREVQA